MKGCTSLFPLCGDEVVEVVVGVRVKWQVTIHGCSCMMMEDTAPAILLDELE